MDTSGIINNTDISQLESMISDYNENIRYYNRNLRDMLELYREGISEERFRRRQRQRRFFVNTNNTNNINDTNFINNNRQNTRQPNQSTFFNNYRNLFRPLEFQDVIVRPTDRQIENATEDTPYDESMSGQTCTISLEPFEPGDRICRIRHCQHIFKRSFVMNWFERNVHCPVCRYDIRDYNRTPNIVEENNDEVEQVEDIDESRPVINTQNLFSNILRTIFTSEMNRNLPYVNNRLNDFLFTFNIPIEFDISYNNMDVSNNG